MARRRYVPARGDLIYTHFAPFAGHEQTLARPALVLSPESFNRKVRLALVAPVTSRVRGHGFEVALERTKTGGAVLCHQVRTIDYRARGARLIEPVPAEVLQAALAKVRVLVA